MNQKVNYKFKKSDCNLNLKTFVYDISRIIMLTDRSLKVYTYTHYHNPFRGGQKHCSNTSYGNVHLQQIEFQDGRVKLDFMYKFAKFVNIHFLFQVEGAFIMGLGYWTCEHLVYDKNTGEILTNRAWTYHVPQARDIPQDFRIYLRKNSYSDAKVLGSKSNVSQISLISFVFT